MYLIIIRSGAVQRKSRKRHPADIMACGLLLSAYRFPVRSEIRAVHLRPYFRTVFIFILQTYTPPPAAARTYEIGRQLSHVTGAIAITLSGISNRLMILQTNV